MNNTNDNPNDPSEHAEVKNNKIRAIVTAIMAIIVILAGIYGLSKIKKPSNATVPPKEKVAQLADAEKQALQKQVDDLENRIKGFTDQTSAADRYQAYLQMSGAYHRLGEYDKALAALDKIADQNKARIWIGYALIYKDMGNTARVHENSKKALDLDMENPQYWVMYIESTTDQSNDAIKNLYAQALQKTENNIDVITSYARFLEKIGDKPGAIAQWQKAVEVNPDHKADYDAQIARLQTQ